MPETQIIPPRRSSRKSKKILKDELDHCRSFPLQKKILNQISQSLIAPELEAACKGLMKVDHKTHCNQLLKEMTRALAEQCRKIEGGLEIKL